jgi:hypothetical protein
MDRSGAATLHITPRPRGGLDEGMAWNLGLGVVTRHTLGSTAECPVLAPIGDKT